MVFVFRHKEAIQMERPERYLLADEERVSQVKKDVDGGSIDQVENVEHEVDMQGPLTPGKNEHLITC